MENIIKINKLPSLDKLVEAGCDPKFMMFVSSLPQHFNVTGIETAHGIIPLTYEHNTEKSGCHLLTNVYPKSISQG